MLLKTIIPFENRNLRIFYYARATSLLGTLLSILAIPLYIYHQTGSGKMLATVALCESLGAALSGLFLGNFADKYSPKSLLILLELSAAFLTALLLVWLQQMSFIFLLAFGIGICGALSLVVGSSLLSIIEKDLNALRFIEGHFSATESFLRCAVPAVGGVLLTMVSSRALLFIDIVSYLVAVVILTQMRITRIKDSPMCPLSKKNPFSNWFKQQIIENFSYVWSSKSIRFLFLVGFLVALSIGYGNGIYIYHMKHTLSGSDMDVAWLLSMAFGASMLGALLSRHLKYDTFLLITGCLFLYTLSYISLFSVKNIWLFIISYSLGDFVNTIYSVGARAYIQSSVDTQLIGRVRGVMIGIYYIGSLMAMMMVSLFVEKIPSAYFYFFSAIATLIAAILGGLVYNSSLRVNKLSEISTNAITI